MSFSRWSILVLKSFQLGPWYAQDIDSISLTSDCAEIVRERSFGRYLGTKFQTSRNIESIVSFISDWTLKKNHAAFFKPTRGLLGMCSFGENTEILTMKSSTVAFSEHWWHRYQGNHSSSEHWHWNRWSWQQCSLKHWHTNSVKVCTFCILTSYYERKIVEWAHILFSTISWIWIIYNFKSWGELYRNVSLLHPALIHKCCLFV